MHAGRSGRGRHGQHIALPTSSRDSVDSSRDSVDTDRDSRDTDASLVPLAKIDSTTATRKSQAAYLAIGAGVSLLLIGAMRIMMTRSAGLVVLAAASPPPPSLSPAQLFSSPPVLPWPSPPLQLQATPLVPRPSSPPALPPPLPPHPPSTPSAQRLAAVQRQRWAKYLSTVYGESTAASFAAQLGGEALPAFTWFYWTAPLPRSMRVWLNFWSGTRERRVERDALLRERVRTDGGDGVLHMYDALGFFRIMRTDPRAFIQRHGRVYVEVIRRPGGGAPSIFYYVAHGSGFWLDLGQSYDSTCSRWTNADVDNEPTQDADAARMPMLAWHTARPSAHGAPAADLTRSRTMQCVVANASQPDHGQVTAHTSQRTLTRRGASLLCRPLQCGSRTGCDPSHGEASVAADERDPCMRGGENASGPPMLRAVAPTTELTAMGFDSYLRWQPLGPSEDSIEWMGRTMLREVVDLRSYLPDGLSGESATCGGLPAEGHASSQNIRTGWRGMGAPCVGCVNGPDGSTRSHAHRHEPEAPVLGSYLNCGSHAVPAAAHNESIRIYFEGLPEEGRTRSSRDDAQAVICGMCYLSSDHDPVALSATSISAFALAAKHRACLAAYFWWPPPPADASCPRTVATVT